MKGIDPLLPVPMIQPWPSSHGETATWPRLPDAALILAIADTIRAHEAPMLVLSSDARGSDQIIEGLRFFAPELPTLAIPEREILPYDIVSAPRDLISQRLAALSKLHSMTHGVIIATAAMIQERLPPPDWLGGSAFELSRGDTFDLVAFRKRLEAAGYIAVSQVRDPGEFATRGALLDVYPSGLENPVRIDLFDNEIDSLRLFDPETQLTEQEVQQIRMLPAYEFPFDENAIAHFRQRWRAAFPGDPMNSPIYQMISGGEIPSGIEAWLPLFFDQCGTLLDYLPKEIRLLAVPGFHAAFEEAFKATQTRFESRRHDIERPLLDPQKAFVGSEELARRCKNFAQIQVAHDESSPGIANLPDLQLLPQTDEPLEPFLAFAKKASRVLLTAESAGRREVIRELLQRRGLATTTIDDWPTFLTRSDHVGIAVTDLEDGFLLTDDKLALVPEQSIFGQRARARRRERRRVRDPEAILRNLTDLAIGAPVVHEEHGVGRYRGLVTNTVDGIPVEFVQLEYAGGDKLYVPVSALEKLSRYIGADASHAPLHRLGSDQWDKARRKAAQRARDVAAELLDLYAKRASRQAAPHQLDYSAYEEFAAAFPFELTADQERTIDDVLDDLRSTVPMDRVICGDVGFGKTEVAMRAAFVTVHAGRQAAILVPTTLLAQQHYRSFLDRFANWPVRIELLSRFRTSKQQSEVRHALGTGEIDIVIGTHALLGRDIHFKNLGLIIVDEEHRFGVRHKERLKALRAEVDVLTLTATPIPRTLSMTMSGLRDLSLIATPPDERLAVKTIVGVWNDAAIRDACMREIRRGGQIYVVHNEVRTIDRLAARFRDLVPEARLRIAHGQMPERDLEQIMLDFYHRRFNVLICTTIIESGIDIPTANTIIIHNAHRFGLAQLHQLRGRVGRSHHQAFAYLVAPPEALLGRDAKARLDAIASLEDLGSGFVLATQDLEIRGAGELLGDEQSGQIEEVGLDFYNELLERAIQTVKQDRDALPPLNPKQSLEIDLGVAALLPEDYIPDIHTRLVLYKRLANAAGENELDALQMELIDRFGLLPEAAKNLFEMTRLKLQAKGRGIIRVQVGPNGGKLVFSERPDIDPDALIRLLQSDPRHFRMHGADEFRFVKEMPDLLSRSEMVTNLLNQLGLAAAA